MLMARGDELSSKQNIKFVPHLGGWSAASGENLYSTINRSTAPLLHVIHEHNHTGGMKLWTSCLGSKVVVVVVFVVVVDWERGRGVKIGCSRS
jgi:hypothetical protein